MCRQRRRELLACLRRDAPPIDSESALIRNTIWRVAAGNDRRGELRVAEEFGTRTYTKQRLKILEKRIERIFENDNNKQSGIADFM
jgi:hypothetical protein